jgi:hypothetical protein
MKFFVFIKIMFLYDYNKFVNHVKSLIIIISQMGFLKGDNHK